MFFNKNDVAQKSMRHEMKIYCTDEQRCRRELINEHFGMKATKKPKDCCNYCDPQLGLSYDFSQLRLC